MFDVKQEIGIKIPAPEGAKHVVVVFPSDGDIIHWRRLKKIQQKDLGRRSFQMEVSRPEACDLELFGKIQRAETGGAAVEIDEAEASYVITKLLECEVTERPEREGSQFLIRMKAMGKLATAHVLRVPSMREMMEYERMRSSVIFGQYGSQEIRINFRAAAELYDKLKVRVEGYAGEVVPVPHKAEAVNVLLQEIREEEPEDPE